MSLQNIPDELKAFPNFTGWNGENRKPLNLRTGGNAQSDNSATWSTFDIALKKCDELTGEFDGAGIAVPGGYVGFDFDGVVKNGVVEPFVQVILRALRDPYCELSPSETGLRAFVRYDGPKLDRTVVAKDDSKGKYGVEIFSGSYSPKVLTMTGNHVSGQGIPVLDSLRDVYALCSRLTNEPFKKLWMGDSTAQGNDDSKADYALLCMLADLTNGNAQRMETHFNSSVRGQREKWAIRKEYRDASIAAALKTWSKKPAYTKTGDNGRALHPILQKAREAALSFDKERMVFDPKAPRRTHEAVLQDFLTRGDNAMLVAPKKTEKSLFSERIAMHIACGKSWCGFKCLKPRKVSYLDAENDGDDVSDRYHELLAEFSPEEQELIGKNLSIVVGQLYADEGGTLDYLNDSFWDWYAAKYAEAEVHILDCLYKFHTKDARDNNGLMEVMDVLRYRLVPAGSGRALITLNHTRSLSNDDLRRSDGMSLERLGADNFSEQSFGGKVLLKNATLVICMDRRVKLNEDGEPESWTIDFQFYGRRVPPSPMLRFEPSNEKFARRLIRDLSKGARKAALDLRLARGDNGAWKSFYEASNDLRSSKSNAYVHLRELTAKEYLVQGADGLYRLHLTNELTSEIVHTEEQNLALQQAKGWLLDYVQHPMKMENVIEVGDEEGHSREDLIRARREVGLVEYDQPDGTMATVFMWRPKKKRGVKKGSATAKMLSKMGVEARQPKHDPTFEQSNLPVVTEPDMDDTGPQLSDLEQTEPPEDAAFAG